MTSTIPEQDAQHPAWPQNLTKRGAPYTPAEVVIDLMQPLIDEHGYTVAAQMCGLPDRSLRRWASGESKWVSFPVLDRIVTYGLDDPSLLWAIPGLELPE